MQIPRYSPTGAAYGPSARAAHQADENGELPTIQELESDLAKSVSAAVSGRSIDVVPLVFQAARQVGINAIMSLTETDAQLPFDAREQPERVGASATVSPISVANDSDYLINQGGVDHSLTVTGGKCGRSGR
jgi:hypothetical protein